MSRKDKKRKGENLLFLMLGLVFGIVGNFFVSSIIELCNVVISSFPIKLKINFWMIFFIAMAYALIWIIERYSILLTKLGIELFSKDDIKFMRGMRKYCIVGIIVSIILFILLWIIE